MWLANMTSSAFLTPIYLSLARPVTAKTLYYYPHHPLENVVECRNPKGFYTISEVRRIKQAVTNSTMKMRIQHSRFTSIVNVLPLPV